MGLDVVDKLLIPFIKYDLAGATKSGFRLIGLSLVHSGFKFQFLEMRGYIDTLSPSIFEHTLT